MCLLQQIKRYCAQLRHDKVVITALGFFSFTNRMVLSVTATIATYIVVMLQQDLNTHRKTSTVNHCDGLWTIVEKTQS
jgi:hypothetical protein